MLTQYRLSEYSAIVSYRSASIRSEQIYSDACYGRHSVTAYTWKTFHFSAQLRDVFNDVFRVPLTDRLLSVLPIHRLLVPFIAFAIQLSGLKNPICRYHNSFREGCQYCFSGLQGFLYHCSGLQGFLYCFSGLQGFPYSSVNLSTSPARLLLPVYNSYSPGSLP